MATFDFKPFEIPQDILSAVAEVDEFKGGWKRGQDASPEQLNALKRVATVESIASSTRIEGSKLSDSEVETLLANLNIQAFTSRDEQEVAGYAEVMDTIFQNYEDIHLTENYIKQLHQILLRHSDKDERHRGGYKHLDNHVEAFDVQGVSLGVIFETSSPFDTPSNMLELLSWTKTSWEDGSVHKLILIGIFIVVFLAIHPFQDGNGRLSRALTTLGLLKAGYTYAPYSSLESIIEENKDAYYLALRRTQASLKKQSPDWIPWLRFFISSLKQQVRRLERKVELSNILADLCEISEVIMSYLSEHKRITMKIAEGLFPDTPRPTLKYKFRRLVEQGRIKRYGKGRGVFYTR